MARPIHSWDQTRLPKPAWIDTRHSQLRTGPAGGVLSYSSPSDLLRDIDQIEAASRASAEVGVDRQGNVGPTAGIHVTGNWSAGQSCQHVAKLIRFSYEGFPAEVIIPWWGKALGRMLRKVILARPMQPGFALAAASPGGPFAPDAQVWTEAGVAELRTQVQRIQAGEIMTHPSPWLGSLSQAHWIRLHLNHAALHLSFIHFGLPPLPHQPHNQD